MLPIEVGTDRLTDEDEQCVSRLGRALTIRQCCNCLRGKQMYFVWQIDLGLDEGVDGVSTGAGFFVRDKGHRAFAASRDLTE